MGLTLCGQVSMNAHGTVDISLFPNQTRDNENQFANCDSRLLATLIQPYFDFMLGPLTEATIFGMVSKKNQTQTGKTTVEFQVSFMKITLMYTVLKPEKTLLFIELPFTTNEAYISE